MWSGAEERQGDDGDPVGASVRRRAGRHNDKVDDSAWQLVRSQSRCLTSESVTAGASA